MVIDIFRQIDHERGLNNLACWIKICHWYLSHDMKHPKNSIDDVLMYYRNYVTLTNMV